LNALTGFSPSTKRAAAIDQRVRDHLSESLLAVRAALDGEIDAGLAGLERLAASVREHQARSCVMGAYASLVQAISSGDDDRCRALISFLCSEELNQPARRRVALLSDSDLGPGMATVYLEHIIEDGGAGAGFTAPPEQVAREDSERIRVALDLLAQADPELAGEIATLTPEIVLVHAPTGEYTFNGGSSFHLWGSILINAAVHPTAVKLIEGFAHESGHSLLHGLTLGHPLVENDPEERHSSPLRADPRPMEGVVHATYVLARMHLAMERLLASGGLDPDQRAEAGRALERCAEAYAEGARIVQAQARFTPLGAEIFAGAAAYMREASLANA
jgi:hypothetical protein